MTAILWRVVVRLTYPLFLLAILMMGCSGDQVTLTNTDASSVSSDGVDGELDAATDATTTATPKPP